MVADRVCLQCNNGQVEDEGHFMLACPVYDDFRNTLWASLSHLTGKSRGDYTDRSALRALLGDRLQDLGNKKYLLCLKKVLIYIRKAMSRRAQMEEKK